jgi:RND family efflux transporter MFP subunit
MNAFVRAPVLCAALLAATAAARAEPPTPALARFREAKPAERLRLLEQLPLSGQLFEKVTRGPLNVTVTERGTLEPVTASEVICRVRRRSKESPVATTVKWVVEDGTLVKKGDRILELDDSAVREQLQVRKAACTRAEATRAQAAEALDAARKETQAEVRLAEIALKLTELEGKKAAADDTQKEIAALKAEQARLVLDRARAAGKAKEARAEADLRAADADASLEAARLKATEEELKNCSVVAPQDGLVVYWSRELTRFGGGGGGPPAPGEEVREGQKLLRVCDLRRLDLSARVHESLVSRVRPGQKAAVFVDAFPDKLRAATVTSVAATASQLDFFSSDVKVYPVLLSLDAEDTALKPGMSAEVRILVARRADAVSVPVQAVLGTRAGTYCFVKTADGIEERRVTTGLRNETAVEIRDGVKEGEEVLRDPRAVLRRLSRLQGRGPGPGANAVLVRSVKPPPEEGGRRTRVVRYGLTYADAGRIAALGGVEELVPVRAVPQEVRRLDRHYQSTVVATTAAYAGRVGLEMEEGRFFTEEDESGTANVAVLGAKAAEQLFPEGNAVGGTVNLNKNLYVVVGVLRERDELTPGVDASLLDTNVFLPLQTFRRRFGAQVVVRKPGSWSPEAVQLSAALVYTADARDAPAVAEEIREQLAASHEGNDWAVDPPGRR